MSNLPTAFGSIREYFALRRAEQTVRGYEARQQERVRAHAAAARARHSAGRRLWQAVPAAALLLESVRHYLLASHAARDAGVDERAPTGDELAAALPPLPPDPARPDAAPSDDERVRAALASTDSLYFDGLTPEDAARTRAALERAAWRLAGHVEARSLANIRGTRWGRRAGVALLALYGAVIVARAIFLPKNVALDKPVHPSTSRHGTGQELVDGELDTVPGVFTGTEESPSAVIDLMDTYAIEEVRVHNRLDQSFDDCLPLAVELSLDGVIYKEIGRRDQHFAADPPWVVAAGRQRARFVRVRVLKRSYLALSEVEVFGRAVPKGR